MASSRLGYLAVKKEATVATAVKPNNFIRFKEGDVKYNQEIIENNPIQNNRWNAITAVPGKVTTDGSYKLDLDAKEFGYFLMATLGSYAVSTLTSGVYKHTFNTANSLPALTLEQAKWNLAGQDHEVDRAFGVLVDSIEITGSDGIIESTVNLKAHGVFKKRNLIADATAGTGATVSLEDTEGLVVTDAITVKDTANSENTAVATIVDGFDITADLANSYTTANKAKVELVPQTPSFSAAQKVFSFIHATFKFGTNLTTAAAAAEENVENWTFTYSNQLEERFWSKRKTPSVIAPKGAMGTLKYTKYFENKEDRDRYMDQTRQACILTLDLGEKIAASAYNYKLELKMSDLRFTSYDMPTGTDDLYIVEVEASLFYDSTDGKAIEITLENDVADYAA